MRQAAQQIASYAKKRLCLDEDVQMADEEEEDVQDCF